MSGVPPIGAFATIPSNDLTAAVGFGNVLALLAQAAMPTTSS